MTKQSITEAVDKLEQLLESSKPTIEQTLYAVRKLESLTLKLNQLAVKLQDSAFSNVLGFKYSHVDFETVCSVPSLLILLKTKYHWCAGALGFDEDSQPMLKQLVEQGLVKKTWIYFDSNDYEEELSWPVESYQEDGQWYNPADGEFVTKEHFDRLVQPRWIASPEVQELAEEIYYGPRPVPQEPPAFEE